MNQSRLLFIQIQTLPSNMNHKYKGTLDIVLQNNLWKILKHQLPTQSPVELKDDSKNSKTYIHLTPVAPKQVFWINSATFLKELITLIA